MNIQITLTRLREEANMSDAEIGEAIGVAQSIITRLRNGVHKTTSYDRGLAIARLAEERLSLTQGNRQNA